MNSKVEGDEGNEVSGRAKNAVGGNALIGEMVTCWCPNSQCYDILMCCDLHATADREHDALLSRVAFGTRLAVGRLAAIRTFIVYGPAGCP